MNWIRATRIVVLMTTLLSACGEDATSDEGRACGWDARVASAADKQLSPTTDGGVLPARIRSGGPTRGPAPRDVRTDDESFYGCPGE